MCKFALNTKTKTVTLNDIMRFPSTQTWTPCSERLPDHEDRVLCCTYTKAGIPNHVIGYHAAGRWCCGMNSNVVAWMPLPDPYVMEV